MNKLLLVIGLFAILCGGCGNDFQQYLPEDISIEEKLKLKSLLEDNGYCSVRFDYWGGETVVLANLRSPSLKMEFAVQEKQGDKGWKTLKNEIGHTRATAKEAMSRLEKENPQKKFRVAYRLVGTWDGKNLWPHHITYMEDEGEK